MGPYYVPAWGYVRNPLKHTLQQKSGLFIFWSPWHTCCGMEGLRVMESLMEALNSGEHFSTGVARGRAFIHLYISQLYIVHFLTCFHSSCMGASSWLRRAPSANGSSRSLLWALQSPLPGHYNLVTCLHCHHLQVPTLRQSQSHNFALLQFSFHHCPGYSSSVCSEINSILGKTKTNGVNLNICVIWQKKIQVSVLSVIVPLRNLLSNIPQ